MEASQPAYRAGPVGETVFKKNKSSKTWGDKTFRNKGARLWNNLPKSIKNITKIKKFTASLKEFKIAKYK